MATTAYTGKTTTYPAPKYSGGSAGAVSSGTRTDITLPMPAQPSAPSTTTKTTIGKGGETITTTELPARRWTSSGGALVGDTPAGYTTTLPPLSKYSSVNVDYSETPQGITKTYDYTFNFPSGISSSFPTTPIQQRPADVAAGYGSFLKDVFVSPNLSTQRTEVRGFFDPSLIASRLSSQTSVPAWKWEAAIGGLTPIPTYNPQALDVAFIGQRQTTSGGKIYTDLFYRTSKGQRGIYSQETIPMQQYESGYMTSFSGGKGIYKGKVYTQEFSAASFDIAKPISYNDKMFSASRTLAGAVQTPSGVSGYKGAALSYESGELINVAGAANTKWGFSRVLGKLKMTDISAGKGYDIIAGGGANTGGALYSSGLKQVASASAQRNVLAGLSSTSAKGAPLISFPSQIFQTQSQSQSIKQQYKFQSMQYRTQQMQLTGEKTIAINKIGSKEFFAGGSASATMPAQTALRFEQPALRFETPAAATATSGFITPPPTPPHIPTPVPPIPLFDFGEKRGGRTYKGKQPKRYTPSYESFVFGFRGKAPKGIETGARIRPITKGFKFYDTKNLKFNKFKMGRLK